MSDRTRAELARSDAHKAVTNSLVEAQKEIDNLKSVLVDMLAIFDARPDIVDRVRPLMGWAEWDAISHARAALLDESEA